MDPQGDGRLSFRGLPYTQNSTSVDGADNDQSFNAVPRGADSGASEEDSDEQERDSGQRLAERRGAPTLGNDVHVHEEAVHEFRISAQNETALYGHGSGGIITAITRGGSDDLHGTSFYNARDNAWGAANPFSIATRYNNGAPTSAVVKPHDLRQQFGGSIGGAAKRESLFYFYAFDQQRRGFPAVSSPANPAFYSLTAAQSALLANRGVSVAKVDAALSYLDSLTGTFDRRSNQTINFGKLDWQASDNHRLSAQYNGVRSSAPAGLRTNAVLDRGIASIGNAYAKVDAVLARWLWIVSPRVTHVLRVAYGGELQYQTPHAPLPQEPAVGPGGLAPEVAIGPQGLTFGMPATLARSGYPDERRVQLAELASWAPRHHLVQAGFDLSFVHDRIELLILMELSGLGA